MRRRARDRRLTLERIEHTVEIDAPPENVFPLLEASDERLRWMGALVESEPLAEGRFRDVFEDVGQRVELEAEVLERGPPEAARRQAERKELRGDERAAPSTPRAPAPASRPLSRPDTRSGSRAWPGLSSPAAPRDSSSGTWRR